MKIKENVVVLCGIAEREKEKGGSDTRKNQSPAPESMVARGAKRME